jgi:hypothetical protein
METIVYEIELNDGRIFRVFCANSTQKRNVIASYNQIKDKVKTIRTITTGIHTAAQYEKIVAAAFNVPTI